MERSLPSHFPSVFSAHLLTVRSLRPRQHRSNVRHVVTMGTGGQSRNVGIGACVIVLWSCSVARSGIWHVITCGLYSCVIFLQGCEPRLVRVLTIGWKSQIEGFLKMHLGFPMLRRRNLLLIGRSPSYEQNFLSPTTPTLPRRFLE